eukprot:superscaffoldBa00007620_g22695
MTSVKEKLFETLEELHFWEFLQFKEVLQELRRQKDLPRVQIERTYSTVDLVELMVELYGQQSVEVTREVLGKMYRDPVQSLTDTSSGSKEKQRSSLPQKDVTMTSVKEKLLETLEELRFGEFLQFKDILQKLQMKEFPRVRIEMAQNKVDLVELMVEICGQQSVEVTMEVLKKMNRTDLVQRLSDISSGSKGPSRSLEFGAHGGIMDETMTPVKKKLLETLEELRFGKIELFKWYLQTLQVKDLPRIPRVRIERADSMDDLVELIVEICGQQSVEVTREVLKRMNRMDLVQSLSDTSSGSKVEETPGLSSKPGSSGNKHFVDKHKVELIKRVSNIDPILDELFDHDVIQQESYDKIRALPTTQKKVRELYCGPLKAGGESKDAFLKLLEEYEPILIKDLKKKK